MNDEELLLFCKANDKKEITRSITVSQREREEDEGMWAVVPLDDWLGTKNGGHVDKRCGGD